MQTGLRGILFDKDGTLIDFRATWVPAYRGVADELADRLGGAAAWPARCWHGRAMTWRPTSSPTTARCSGRATRRSPPHGTASPEIEGRIDVLEVVLRHFSDVGRYPPQAVGDLRALLGRLRGRGLALGVATMDDTAIAHAHLAISASRTASTSSSAPMPGTARSRTRAWRQPSAPPAASSRPR